MATKVITKGDVRFSYANVFEPKAINEGDTPKYSVSIIIPKTDTATIAEIEAAIEEAKELGKTSKFGGKIPATLKTPLRDGDLERPDDVAYQGCMFFNANSTNAPGVVDAARKPIMNRDDFYSGCYGRVSVIFYPYVSGGSKGIAAGLQNLMKTKEGDRLSGGASAEDDFGSEADDLM